MIRVCPFGQIGPKEAEAVGCIKEGCMAWVSHRVKVTCPRYDMVEGCRCDLFEPHCRRLE